MKRSGRRFLFGAVLVAIAGAALVASSAQAGPVTDSVAVATISTDRETVVPVRFRKISSRLFRSSQPESLGAFKFFRQQGIQTIIDFRSGAATEEEKAVAESLGFRYVNIPLSLDSTPRDYLQAERRFFAVLDDPSTGRAVIHCRQGKDRTGLMAALYEVERQGRAPEQAIAEWKRLGGYEHDWGIEIQYYFRARVKQLATRTCLSLFK